MIKKLFIGCDMEVPYEGAFANGNYINDATVTYTLRDRAGAPVAGGSGSCPYVAESNGDYLGVIESTVTALCANRQKYTLLIVMSAPNDVNDTRVIELQPAYRGEE
ncbi:hypothetical protein VT84_03370 [Gemmata sp. SH-PL17]|uniref:hypothetical protein n=1 Tax=Gemmata sp. SH-PL17 TaxID=1630693 RepID=UPI00078E1FD8|nr:hypothetical protein [Gemmata sp. SH-PL17]AMV23423.1 hypothetical protein VT84_03370 [Gemmata sp. SH-PL17]